MPRIRYVPVMHNVCGKTGCGAKFEGQRCPKGHAFDPATCHKASQKRLIVVGVDPPPYERTKLYRCTECRNLFDLSDDDLAAYARCGGPAHHPLFSEEQVLEMWAGTETLLQRARKLQRARSRVKTCPECPTKVNPMGWCPRCRAQHSGEGFGGLPQNPTTVWVRTFYSVEGHDDAQTQDALSLGDAGETEPWRVTKRQRRETR